MKLLIVLFACAAAAALPCRPVRGASNLPKRIVFVGDSITDGNSYPLLLAQALAEAYRPVPTCVNAGIGGDTAAGMRARIERDVLIHHPDLVTLSVGINDSLRGVTPAAYEADVRAICERLAAEKIPVLLLTTSILGPKNAAAETVLAEYNAFLHRLAAERGYAVAEVNRDMQAARAAGRQVMETDDVHPNYEGHRIMARALLDALGCGDVRLPKEMKVSPMPGIIREWRLRAVGEKDPPLDEAAAAALRPDASWKRYPLPEARHLANWWLDQERRRGFAVSVREALGPARGYQGWAAIESRRARKVYLNPGAQLQAVWVNGKRVYKMEGWPGWHAGRERIAVELPAGRSTLLIETGGEFFLSITERNDW